jgi:hypothetical protein
MAVGIHVDLQVRGGVGAAAVSWVDSDRLVDLRIAVNTAFAWVRQARRSAEVCSSVVFDRSHFVAAGSSCRPKSNALQADRERSSARQRIMAYPDIQWLLAQDAPPHRGLQRRPAPVPALLDGVFQ